MHEFMRGEVLVVSRFFAPALGFVLEQDGRVGFGEGEDDESEAEPGEYGEDPEEPAPGDPFAGSDDTADDRATRVKKKKKRREAQVSFLNQANGKPHARNAEVLTLVLGLQTVLA